MTTKDPLVKLALITVIVGAILYVLQHTHILQNLLNIANSSVG